MRFGKAAKILLCGVAGLLVLVLLLMLGIKLALDRAPAYQSQIKAWVNEQTGYHIAFARVSPSFRWYGPELHFDQLELRSKDDRRVLARAGGGRVAADIWQLISSGKLLAGRIELDFPHFLVARLGSSNFALASEVRLGSDEISVSALGLDDLPAGKLAIRHAMVTMQNWNAALPELSLQDVNLDVSRDANEIALLFTARLPPSLGGVIAVSASAHGPGTIRSLDWTAMVKARDIAFPGWRLLLPQYLSRLDAGAGGFELSAGGHGPSLARADLDFGARGVATQLSEGPIVTFEQIRGVLTIMHSSDRWTVSGTRVRALRGGHADPESQFTVSWRGAGDGLLELSARASYLRAETLLPLMGLLPQKDLRDRLQELAPTGEWRDAAVALKRAAAADPWKLQVQAKFRGVGFAPIGRTPGLRGLSGSVAGNEGGGRLDIDSRRALFTWPTQFPQPVEVDELKTTLYWKRGVEGLLVATPNWHMSNRDGDVRAKLAWRQPTDDSSPVLTLASSIDNGNVSQVRNYLPRERIAPRALAWLSRAFAAGRMPHADVVIQGPIRRFPFRDASGTFLARCSLEGVTLDYIDGWPRVEGLSAQAEFRNEGMSARFLSGNMGGVPVSAAEARFADFKTGELQIHISAAGEAADALSFLSATPLDAADHAFSGIEAKGSMKAEVDLFLPFKDFIHRRILVEGNLDGVTVNRRGSSIMASDVRGAFGMEGGQVAHADLRGRFLGGSFQMQARAPRIRPVLRTQLDFRGTLTGDALRAALALPAGIAIGGQSDWRAVFKMSPEPARERSLRVSSNLIGLEMKLPAPLEKAGGTPLSSWFEIQWPAGGGPQGRLALGSVVGGSFALESDANGLHLAHASLTFGADEAISSESQMVNLGGSIARLDLAGWLRLGTSDKSSKPLATYLRKASLNVAELDYLGLAFRDVSLDLAASPEGSLRIAVGGPNVLGTISVAGAPNSNEALNLKFERLHFDASAAPRVPADAEHASDDAPAAANPRSIPAINFHAADLAFGGRQFGDVQATLVRLEDGISLKQLTVTGRKFTATAKGEWRGPDAGLGRMEGTIKSSDVQDTLKELGYAEVLEAKNGSMDFDLTWAGAPSGAALSTASGRVQISLENGQIVGLKPGAGRVLGLTSVAALRRRLALDFSDLTDKGLAFDTATGDFDLRDGSAYTDNVLVKGPAAEIGLIGRIGLKNKDYDQTAVVTGSVSNSLPLAALAGGPVIGAAVLVFTQVFKQSLKGLARGYYRITGSWDSPTVERIKSADAAAAAAEVPK